jgi:hypothetical protein
MKKVLIASGLVIGMILGTGCNTNSPQGVSINATTDYEQTAAACSPYFSKQPANATSPCGSVNWVKFSVTTAGATISQYQWYYNYDGGANRSPCNTKYFTGGTTANLSVAPQSEVYLWCWARANCGTTIWSNRVKLSISKLSISKQPVDLTDPCGVANWMTFTVQAAGATEYTYEWQWSQSSAGPFYSCINDKYFENGNTPNLRAYPVDTRWVRCIVTAPVCGQTVVTRVAKFTVCWQ